MGQTYQFPVDTSFCPVLSAIVSQLLSQRDSLYISVLQYSDSVSETHENRSAPNFPDGKTVNVVSLFTNL
jgi:hypothetical protein